MIPKIIRNQIKRHEYVTIATSDLKGRPDASPKYLLEIEGNAVYFVDYVINKTWVNIKRNPHVSISVADDKPFVAYQLKGKAQILPKGKEYDQLKSILDERVTDMSVEKVIAAVKKGFRSQHYEIAIPTKVIIFKVNVSNINVISPTRSVKKQKLDKLKITVKKPIIKADMMLTTTPVVIPKTLKKVYREGGIMKRNTP